MRPRHEIVAGLGTMGSLVAAIGCVFALAGGVVAFRGWPELDSAGSGPTLVVSDVPRAPLQVAAVHRSKPSHPAARQATAGARVAKAPRRVIASAPERIVKRGSGQTTRPAAVPKPPATTPPPTPGPLAPVADTAEQTTTGLGKAVSGTTDALGNVVGGPLGETVTTLGSDLGETVTKTGTLVANLLRGISPSP
jgi:hypothetical protein